MAGNVGVLRTATLMETVAVVAVLDPKKASWDVAEFFWPVARVAHAPWASP